MNTKNTITASNMVDHTISTITNNSDEDYKTPPCVVMNNLVETHNGIADEMGDDATFNNSNNLKEVIETPLVRNIPLKSNFENEEKIYKEPVDYDIAFGEYYPDEMSTETELHENKE